MIFKEGNTVKFIHTGDIGEVVEVLDSETVLVLLDGDEIPTDVENIVVWKNEAAYSPLEAAKKTALKPKKTLEVKARIIEKPKNDGLMIACQPSFDNEGNINRFDLFLVNDTAYKVIYTFKMKVLEYFTPEKNDLIAPRTAKKIGDFSQYDLSDNPTLLFNLWQVTTAGMGTQLDKSIKIKPKQFFKKVKNHSFTAIPCYTYELTKQFIDGKEEEDLRTYTKRNIKEEKEEKFYDFVKVNEVSKIEDKADFSVEIDLHIEKLTDSHRTMLPAEMLQLQMQVFEDYLSQAIRLGIPKIYVIHGLGKGSLRNEIQKRLLRNPYVKIYQNNHHPKYGFGATEVYLD